MADNIENGAGNTQDIRNLFDDTHTSCSLPDSIWPCGDMNPEKHDESKKKFMLSGEPMSKAIQDMPVTSYGIPGGQSCDGEFDYQTEMQGLEKLSAELDAVRQQLTADILRCQLLQVDLATQFDPGLVQQLRSTKLSCEKCENVLDDSFEAEVKN